MKKSMYIFKSSIILFIIFFIIFLVYSLFFPLTVRADSNILFFESYFSFSFFILEKPENFFPINNLNFDSGTIEGLKIKTIYNGSIIKFFSLLNIGAVQNYYLSLYSNKNFFIDFEQIYFTIYFNNIYIDIGILPLISLSKIDIFQPFNLRFVFFNQANRLDSKNLSINLNIFFERFKQSIRLNYFEKNDFIIFSKTSIPFSLFNNNIYFIYDSKFKHIRYGADINFDLFFNITFGFQFHKNFDEIYNENLNDNFYQNYELFLILIKKFNLFSFDLAIYKTNLNLSDYEFSQTISFIFSNNIEKINRNIPIIKNGILFLPSLSFIPDPFLNIKGSIFFNHNFSNYIFFFDFSIKIDTGSSFDIRFVLYPLFDKEKLSEFTILNKNFLNVSLNLNVKF